MRKYEILKNDYKTFSHPHFDRPVRVFRIIYTKDFKWCNPFTDSVHEIRDGMIGGFVQSESNLSHDDTSVILNNAIVFGNGTLINSMLRDTSAVFDDAVIENSEVFGAAKIFAKTKAIHCLFRDNCNIGGILDLQRCYITNSAQISGVCKVYDTEMYIGSIIRGQCSVYDSKMTDVSEICGISTVRNCHLTGRAYLKNVNVQNQSFNENILLSITQKEGDLFPH